MGILNDETLAGFTNQGDELKNRVKFWRDNTKLVAEYDGAQYKLETSLSFKKASELEHVTEGDLLGALRLVCDNADGLEDLPATVSAHIFVAYSEAVSAVQGVELGE